jgi:hypothetical protein
VAVKIFVIAGPSSMKTLGPASLDSEQRKIAILETVILGNHAGDRRFGGDAPPRCNEGRLNS